jgi:hypothetical protein
MDAIAKDAARWSSDAACVGARGKVFLLPTLLILSVAKDLMPIASGDEVLRYAQDDKRTK